MATLTALFKIGADISGLQAGMSKAVASIDSMEKNTSKVTGTLTTMAKVAAGAFSVNAVADMGRQALDTAGKVQDAADKMGIAAESVQRLQFAAEQGGASLDSVSRSLAFMAKTLDDKGTPAKMEALGLNLDAIRAMAPDQAFIAIADAIGKLTDPIQQATLAQELLGRGAMDLMPAMKAGFSEIGAMAPVMSNAMVKSADDTGDAIALMHKRVDTLKAQAMLPLLNMFTSLPSAAQTAIGGIAAFTPSLTGLASLVMMSGGPVAAFAALGTMFTVTLPAAFATVLPFLGPIGIIAVAVGAVVLAWRHWDSIVDFVKGVYTAIKTFVIDKIIPVLAVSGPLLGPVGMVITIWSRWSQITAIAKAVYDGVKAWLVDKFNAIVDSIKAKVEAVTGFFANMYDKVIGHSFVPDMVKGIAGEFSKLQAVMVDPSVSAVDKVIAGFEKMADLAGGKVRAAVQDIVDAWRSAGDAIEAYNNATNTSGRIAAIGQGAMGMWEATGSKSRWGAVGGGAMSGMATGAMIGSVVPVLGTAAGAVIGAAAGAIMGFVRSANQGREAVEAFAKSAGGFDALHAQLNTLGAEGERLWIQLTQGVGRNSPEQARAAIEAIVTAFEDQGAAATAATAAALRMNETLISGGVSAVNNLTGEYNRLWDSIRDEAPEAVMGMVETATRARMESIADEREGMVEQLKGLTDSLGAGFEGVLSQLDEFIDRLGSIPPVNIQAGITYHDGSEMPEDVPGFKEGSGGIRDFGRGTLAMLHGREGVFTEAQLRGTGGGGGTTVVHTHVHLDGREIAVNTTHHQSQMLRARRLVGAG